MARPLRIEYPGAIYHVTSRGNDKKAIFKDEQDRENILRTLQHVNKRYHWLCHAFCLMDNHYHLLIETPDGNLALGMRQLNGVYTQLFNNRHNRTGHIFQGRYKSVLIQKDTHLLEVCRYVVLNPVRARMVEKPGDWKWSSYRATAGQTEPHPCLTRDWVLGQFGRIRAKATKEYRQFVSWGINKETIWTEVKGQILLGDDDFVDSHAGHLRKRHRIPEIPKSQRYANRQSLDAIFTQRILDNTRKRDTKIIEAVEQHGYRQTEIAQHLKLHTSTLSNIIRHKQ